MEDGVTAGFLLGAIVVEQAEGVFAQPYDGVEVAGREQGHAQVAQAPDQIEAGQGAENDHAAAGEQAVEGHHPFAPGQEADVGLAIIIVSDDARVGEQQDGGGHEDGAEATHFRLERRLRQGDAVQSPLR